MNTQPVSIYGMLAVALLLMNAVILETALVKNADWYKALWVTLPLMAVAIYKHKKRKKPQVKNSIDRSSKIVFE
jgi:hypothetical protein